MDRHRLSESAHAGLSLVNHDLVAWHCHFKVELRKGDWSYRDILKGLAPKPFEVAEHSGNLLLTAGATALWNGLVTAGLATPFNSTNAQIGVGDSVTASTAGMTDLQAALGTKLNASDVTTASNTTPIVIAGTFSPVPAVGSVVACSGFTGAGAAAINGTFELSAATAASLTLLNSAGSGAITVTGAVIQPVNKYRQLVNGAPIVTTNSVAFVAVFATGNANYIWNEWGIATGGAATNKQAVPPPTMLNRAVADLLTKTASASATATMTLSLA